MSYELIPLGELGEIISGSTPDTTNKLYWGGDIPWITPADLINHEGIYFTGNLRKITEAGYKSCSTRMLPAGSILFSSRAPIGHCAVTSFPLCTNQGFKSIIPNERLDPVYGFFALGFFTPQIEALGRGATFTEINKEIFEGVRIPLPPLSEQRRIAARLAQADRLRRLRRYADQLGGSYLQSVFVEMFYKKANKEWARSRIADLVPNGSNKIRTGPFGSQLLHSEFQEEGEVAVLGIDNAVQNHFTRGKSRYITLKKYKQLKRYTVFPGDVIITIMATTGRCAVVPDTIPLAINTKHLCCITLDHKKCLPSFLQASFLYHPSVLKQMGGSERGAIMPGLNMEIIKDLEIYLPPLAEQERFAAIVQRYERLRLQQHEAGRQAEMLFQSLLSQAFGGGL